MWWLSIDPPHTHTPLSRCAFALATQTLHVGVLGSCARPLCLREPGLRTEMCVRKPVSANRDSESLQTRVCRQDSTCPRTRVCEQTAHFCVCFVFCFGLNISACTSQGRPPSGESCRMAASLPRGCSGWCGGGVGCLSRTCRRSDSLLR